MLLQPGEEFYSQLLQQLRAEQCMSQRRLAELTGINRTVLRKFELGTGRLDVRNYARVLVPLGHNLEVVTEANLLERLRRQAAIEADPRLRSELAARILLEMTI
jgi:transcriptional regulator with XRE-family HTH domain